MALTPEQEAFLEQWLKRRASGKELGGPQRRKPSAKNLKKQNPKWSADSWFEARYGDPDYYDRIKGLN